MRKSLLIATAIFCVSGGLGAYAENASTEKFRSIAAVENATNPISATITPIKVKDEAVFSKGVLHVGDQIGFEVTGIEGAKLYILNMDSEGTISMIYPNKFDEGGEVESEDTLMLPQEDSKYHFEATGAGGTEIVKFIAITGDSSTFDTLLQGMFDQKDTFPKSIEPASETSDTLNQFFESANDSAVRETTLEYVITE
ncbi:DUF4384 domain-containing protein [Nitratireductor sp. XY-223]|uniref:DUF4384 domain-containing protein n=1 Tax=Nitratireductor sp. XY-223 TaxID=2561926 RepID=UPI0010AA29BE|nr:DUF4384 domain-containing protein [Nitratireductor sp. XY-223]